MNPSGRPPPPITPTSGTLTFTADDGSSSFETQISEVEHDQIRDLLTPDAAAQEED